MTLCPLGRPPNEPPDIPSWPKLSNPGGRTPWARTQEAASLPFARDSGRGWAHVLELTSWRLPLWISVSSPTTSLVAHSPDDSLLPSSCLLTRHIPLPWRELHLVEKVRSIQGGRGSIFTGSKYELLDPRF